MWPCIFFAKSVEQDQLAHTCSAVWSCSTPSAVLSLGFCQRDPHPIPVKQWLCLCNPLQDYIGLLIVLGFKATLTAKVIPWRSVTHMCFLLSHTSTNTTFLSKATDYCSHMLLQRWEAKIRRKEKSPQPGIELTTTRCDTLTTEPPGRGILYSTS